MVKVIKATFDLIENKLLRITYGSVLEQLRYLGVLKMFCPFCLVEIFKMLIVIIITDHSELLKRWSNQTSNTKSRNC